MAYKSFMGPDSSSGMENTGENEEEKALEWRWGDVRVAIGLTNRLNVPEQSDEYQKQGQSSPCFGAIPDPSDQAGTRLSGLSGSPRHLQ